MPDSQPRNLRTAREIGRRDIVFAVARVPNSTRLIIGTSAGKVFELDASQAADPGVELANHGRYVTAVGLAGQTVISGGYDGRLIWWDLANRQTIRTVDAHTRQIRMIAIAPDGTKFASVGDDMICRIWNVADGRKLFDLRGHEERTPTHFTSMLYCCAISRDGRRLATGDRVGHVVIWDVESGRQLSTVEAPLLYTWDAVQRIRSIGGIRALAFSPDGTHLAVGGVGQIGNIDGLDGPSRVEIFDWQRRQRVHEFTGVNGMITRLIYHPDNQWICALGGGGGGIVNFHDPVRRVLIHQAAAPMFVHDAVPNEDFTTIYAVGHQKAAVLEIRA